ncbi:MAG TPA: methionine adenosyltransferase, partial [Pyrodictium sp.]|nr:methionine adenosyltransferase [Pyrodictium sp.]
KKIYEQVKGIREVYVELLSQIGKPINEPLIANIKILPEKPDIEITGEIKREVEGIVSETLDSYAKYTREIVSGRITVF